MSSKETKQKLKDLPGVTMDELVRRGEVSEFAHLEEVQYSKDETVKFSEWLKARTDGEKQE